MSQSNGNTDLFENLRLELRYKGKLYLYFGITPALILFWPFVSLSGHHLYQRQAVEILLRRGYLAGAGVLWALWRRCFSEVSIVGDGGRRSGTGLRNRVFPLLLPGARFTRCRSVAGIW